MINYKKQGKRNQINGAIFERLVRKDLEKDWIVSKWQNNLNKDKEDFKCVPAKSGRFRRISTGFPDFIIYKIIFPKIDTNETLYKVIFVEVKTNGYLSKEEKEKANWYLRNSFCSEFWIAKKTKIKNRIKIEYKRI